MSLVVTEIGPNDVVSLQEPRYVNGSAAAFFITCTSPSTRLRFETSPEALPELKVWDLKLKLEGFLPNVSAVDMILSLRSIKLDDDWEGLSFGLQHGTELTVHFAANSYDFGKQSPESQDNDVPAATSISGPEQQLGHGTGPPNDEPSIPSTNRDATPSRGFGADFSADISSVYPESQRPATAGGQVPQQKFLTQELHAPPASPTSTVGRTYASDVSGKFSQPYSSGVAQQASLLSFFRHDLNKATSRLRIEIGLRQDAQRQVAALRKELSDAMHHRTVAESAARQASAPSAETSKELESLRTRVAELTEENQALVRKRGIVVVATLSPSCSSLTLLLFVGCKIR